MNNSYEYDHTTGQYYEAFDYIAYITNRKTNKNSNDALADIYYLLYGHKI